MVYICDIHENTADTSPSANFWISHWPQPEQNMQQGYNSYITVVHPTVGKLLTVGR